MATKHVAYCNIITLVSILLGTVLAQIACVQGSVCFNLTCTHDDRAGLHLRYHSSNRWCLGKGGIYIEKAITVFLM